MTRASAVLDHVALSPVVALERAQRSRHVDAQVVGRHGSANTVRRAVDQVMGDVFADAHARRAVKKCTRSFQHGSLLRGDRTSRHSAPRVVPTAQHGLSRITVNSLLLLTFTTRTDNEPKNIGACHQRPIALRGGLHGH